jgi:hypothetical protein
MDWNRQKFKLVSAISVLLVMGFLITSLASYYVSRKLETIRGIGIGSRPMWPSIPKRGSVIPSAQPVWRSITLKNISLLSKKKRRMCETGGKVRCPMMMHW